VLDDAFENIVATMEFGYRAHAGAALVVWLRAVEPCEVCVAYDDLALAWTRLDRQAQLNLVLQAVDVLRLARDEAVPLKLAQLETLLD
jgi:hypothetical protein